MIYDHFKQQWIDPATWTEVYIKRHNLKRIMLNICYGAIVSVCMGVMSLATIILMGR